MIARGPLWLPLAILLGLALLSFWIEHSVRVNPAGNGLTRAEPEGIMENFDALRTDAAGQPHYRLTARRLKHYTGSRRTELEAPRFAQYDAEAGEVRASAREATVSPDGNEVDLRGDVVVERAAHAGRPPLTLRTAHLIAYPDRDLLRAPGKVEIRDNTLNVHAGAMEFDTKRRVITLTGRVQARYGPGKS